MARIIVVRHETDHPALFGGMVMSMSSPTLKFINCKWSFDRAGSLQSGLKSLIARYNYSIIGTSPGCYTESLANRIKSL